jgi:hypothetical protein
MQLWRGVEYSSPRSREFEEALEEVHARFVLACELPLLVACSSLADEHMPHLPLREQTQRFMAIADEP